MKLKKLNLRRFSGFKRPLELQEIGPGLNVIVGPNASGKTSICQAVRHLLWPHEFFSPEPISLQSEWESSSGIAITMIINEAASKENPRVIEPAYSERLLPDPAFVSCFSMTIDELFDGKDRGFAQKIGQAMAGGYDLEQAARHCMPEVPSRVAVREWKEVSQRLEQYQKMEAQLRKDSEQLPALEKAVEEAKEAQRRQALLEKKIEFSKAHAKAEIHRKRMNDFLPELASARIDPSDLRLWKEVTQALRQLEELGEMFDPISDEVMKMERDRIGRMQSLEAQQKELARQMEKKHQAILARQQLLGLSIDKIEIGELDRWGILWKECDKIEMEKIGIEEQLRFFSNERETLLSRKHLIGLLAIAWGFGGWVLWQERSLFAVGGVALLLVCSLGLQQESELKWKQRRSDLQVRLAQKSRELQMALEKLHEQIGHAQFCRTHVELIDQIKLLHGDSIAWKEIHVDMELMTQQLTQEKLAWQNFVEKFDETNSSNYWEIYTRIQDRLARQAERRKNLFIQQQILERAGCSFEKIEQLFEQWPAYQEERRQLRYWEAVIQELPSLDVEQADLLEEEQKSNAIKIEQLAECAEKKGELMARLAQIESAIEGETLCQERHEKMEKVRAICFDFVQRELIAKCVAEVQSQFQQHCQPVVLSKAMEWFQKFTQHQFRLEVPKSMDYSIIEIATGERRTLNQLSRGTRMQLLIAIRLSFAMHSEEGGETLPIFLDEVLANTDAERFNAIADVVAELLAAGRQIFYLTCNREDVLKWKLRCSDLHLIDLRQLHTDQAYCAAPLHESSIEDRLPKPHTQDVHEYAQTLKLPALRIDEPLQLASIHYLVENAEDVYRLVNSGICTYGQFQALPSDRLEKSFPTTYPIMQRRAHLLEQFFLLRTQGRGKKLTRDALLKGGVSKTFIEPLWSLAEEKNQEAKALLAVLADRKYKDERKKGFRQEAKEALHQYLSEQGYFDERPVLLDDEIRCELLPLTLKDEDRQFLEQLLCLGNVLT